MERILNAPMLPDRLRKTRRITPKRGQKITPLTRHRIVKLHLRLDPANAGNVGPGTLHPQALNIAGEPVAARLNTTMIGIDALVIMAAHIRQPRRLDYVEKELDLAMQRRMVVPGSSPGHALRAKT